jgi:hypothetical protein
VEEGSSQAARRTPIENAVLGAQINALTVKALKDPWVQKRYADSGATTWRTTLR